MHYNDMTDKQKAAWLIKHGKIVCKIRCGPFWACSYRLYVIAGKYYSCAFYSFGLDPIPNFVIGSSIEDWADKSAYFPPQEKMVQKLIKLGLLQCGVDT